MARQWTPEEIETAEQLYDPLRHNYDEVAQTLGTRTARAVEGFIHHSKKSKYNDSIKPQVIRQKQNRIIPPERVLVYGDVHYPFQDDAAVAIMFEVAKDFGPQLIIINGDLLDNFEASHFVRRTPNFVNLREEVEMGKQHLRVLRARHPQADIWYNESNHECRFVTYIAEKAPALLSLAVNPDGTPGPISLASLLELDKLNIHYNPAVNRESYLDLGSILVGHWLKYSKHSGFAVKHLIEELGISLIQGHTHHIGVHAKTWIRREVVGYEGGCLCSLLPEYAPHPNWQQGFCLIYFHDKYFKVQEIQIVRTAENYIFAMFGDKMYKRKVAA